MSRNTIFFKIEHIDKTKQNNRDREEDWKADNKTSEHLYHEKQNKAVLLRGKAEVSHGQTERRGMGWILEDRWRQSEMERHMSHT